MKHPPYHLRVNKAVDRLMLVDVVRSLSSDQRYREYTYYSLAGPFLEDLRVMDHYFPDMRLISLEANEQTFRRQEFHKFNSRIDIRRTTFRNFISADYLPGEKDIFWLDYTDLRYPHFEEFQQTLQKVPPGSVVRITLRAEPEFDIESLNNRVSPEEISKVRASLQEDFESEFKKVLPHPVPSAFDTPKNFVSSVQNMVKRAASIALDTPGSSCDFLHVHSVYYSDNTIMISVTGIVCLRNEIDRFKSQLSSMKISDFEWNLPRIINIPSLSIKERMLLEKYLPISSEEDSGSILFEKLSYKIDDSDKRCKQQLAHYAEYFRDYPLFIRTPI
jgi:hypothetical protein